VLGSLTRHLPGDTTLSRSKGHHYGGLGRREFLIRFCQGAGATLIPARLWSSSFAFGTPLRGDLSSQRSGFYLHPHYRSERPLDATLKRVQPGSDAFVLEKYADQLLGVLEQWSATLLQAPHEIVAIANNLDSNFSGASPKPAESRIVRSAPPVEVRQNKFGNQPRLAREAFLAAWQSSLSAFSKIEVAEFQITGIDAVPLNVTDNPPSRLETRIRYEIVGTGADFHREQRIGNWQLRWERKGDKYLVSTWQVLDETQARSPSPVYVDITSAALARNASYSEQMLHGADYWRTVLDGAAGLDVYGHNGVSVADIDNDGFDDL
jgi:hypothetical protein